MDVARRPPSERREGDNDNPPVREIEREQLPGRRYERVIEVEREVPFIDREVPHDRR